MKRIIYGIWLWITNSKSPSCGGKAQTMHIYERNLERAASLILLGQPIRPVAHLQPLTTLNSENWGSLLRECLNLGIYEPSLLMEEGKVGAEALKACSTYYIDLSRSGENATTQISNVFCSISYLYYSQY